MDIGSSPSRAPLQPRTTPSSPTLTLKQVRRKNSFLLRADSSEDYPSPHDSIFEAFYFSGTNSDESLSRIELITIHGHKHLGVVKDGGGNNENREPSASSIANNVDDIQFRYGHGTALETITEQKSFGTIRTISRAKSADDVANSPFLNHRDSFVLAKSPRRKHSFSLDDLALINKSYHEACAMIERETCKACKPPLEVPEVYAQPMKPLHAPPERPQTPPGMPSWTAAQNAPPRVRRITYSTPPVKQNRFQRFFGLPASNTIHSSIVPPNGNIRSQGRVVSAPPGGRIAPRFRPPRSAYGGPIDQHPFSRAPMAKVLVDAPPLPPPPPPPEESIPESSANELVQPQVKRKKSKGKRQLGKQVRFTPSATARDSEALALQVAIESTSASAIHPLAPMETFPQPPILANKHACRHYRRKQSPSILSRTDGITTPPSINYDDLPSGTALRLQPVRPRQFLSPITSPNGPNFSTLSLGESMIPAGLVTDMQTLENHISSVSSTTHLMSGALRPGTTAPDPCRPLLDGRTSEINEKVSWCWKCKIERGWQKMDRFFIGAAGMACFICCGYDIEDDGSISYSDNGAVFNPFNSGLRGEAGMFHRPSISLAPRKVALDETPEVAF